MSNRHRATIGPTVRGTNPKLGSRVLQSRPLDSRLAALLFASLRWAVLGPAYTEDKNAAVVKSKKNDGKASQDRRCGWELEAERMGARRAKGKSVMNGEDKRAISITARTALLSWLVAIGMLLVFVGITLPQQKRIFIENLESKATSAAVSLREVVASATLNEDYPSVIDHCNELIAGDKALEYIVIAKNDGFSLIFSRPGWRSEPSAAKEWRPEKRETSSGIGFAELVRQRLFKYSMPFDHSGMQWGWIHIGISLKSYDAGVRAVYLRTAQVAVACIVLSLFAFVAYAKSLVRPILDLRTVVQRVAGGDLSARATIQRRDEVGGLANSVNLMTEALLRRDKILMEAKETLEQRVLQRTEELQEQVAAKERARCELAEAQHRLLLASRQAGMAEVATGVLHNVGNVLNSINVSTTLVRENLHKTELPSLRKLSSLIEEHRSNLGEFLTSDAKGMRIPAFLGRLVEHLGREHIDLVREHEQLAKNVEHVKEIVAMQQSYARVSGVKENVSLAQLVDDALQMNAAGLSRHGVQVIRRYGQVPAITIDKHKVLQIIVNLVHNAKYALDEVSRADKHLTVGIEMEGNSRVKVTVVDNGVGIKPENLNKIFSHGFTTRKDGHGFGLHTGANAAKEMGGSLRLYSDGEGKGVRAVLELPLIEED